MVEVQHVAYLTVRTHALLYQLALPDRAIPLPEEVAMVLELLVVV